MSETKFVDLPKGQMQVLDINDQDLLLQKDTNADVWKTRAIYCRMTSYCIGIYIFLFLLNLSVLIWLFTEWGEKPSTGVLALEFIVNVTLVLEIVFNLVVEESEFFKDWFNILDVMICFACLFCLGIMIYEYAVDSLEVGAAVDNFLIIIRTIFRILRFCFVMKKAQATQEFTEGIEDVNFDEVDVLKFQDLKSENSLDDVELNICDEVVDVI